MTGVDLNEFFHDPKTTLECEIQTFEQIEVIGNPLPDMGSVPVASGLGGVVQFDDAGFISVHPNPRIVAAETVEDLDWLEPGDPYGDNYMRKALESLQYMVDNCPAGYRINPHPIQGAYTTGANIRGISEFCIDTLIQPQFVKRVLEVVIETQFRFLTAQKEILGSLSHILVGDDLSAFLSEPVYRQFILPTYSALLEAFPETPFWLHNDSTARHVAPAIGDSGMKAWHYHPDIAPQDALELTGGRVTLLGGLSPLDLQKWTAQETYDKSIEVLESFGGNTKFVLAAGGSVNQVPVENIMAMFKAADDFEIQA